MKKYLPIIVVAAFILFVAGVYMGNKPTTHTVTLTKDGYMPARLSIRTGDTVVFKNETDSLFWPASNLHPTHDIYSEFDPKEPIEKDKTWSFTFRKTGEWKYHDHLAPYYEGVVVVGNQKQLQNTSSKTKSDRDCTVLTEGDRKACWEEQIAAALDEGGVTGAFDLIATLYETQPLFASPCHDLTHRVGQTAYLLYARDKNIDISEKASYCSFGFYHGFMETLVAKGGKNSDAREFCLGIEKKLGATSPNSSGACFHGIGHGWTDVYDKKYYANEEALVERGLKLCEEVVKTQRERVRCTTGVFDSISFGYYNRLNGLVMRKDNPLWLCHKQPEKYKEACYRDMMPAVLWLGENTLAKSAPVVEQHAERAYAGLAIRSIANGSVRFIVQKEKSSAYIDTCLALREDLVEPCLIGLSDGTMEFGKPGEEYKEAIEYCSSPNFPEKLRATCYGNIQIFSFGLYPVERVQAICKELQAKTGYVCDPFWPEQ